MKRLPILVFIVLTLLASFGAAPVYASEPSIYIVQPGDTLIRISARHGVSVSQLAGANGLHWNSWVYVGQQLVIPGDTEGSTRPSEATTYIVQRGDTLTRIAARYGVSVSRLARASGLRRYSWVYVGQRLTIPEGAPPSVPQDTSGERWIDVNMRGPGYYLRDVPYVMYFYKDYGLHGTYWHDNFGTPMSHGCVNLSSADAQWLFNWASVGTRVVTHY